MNKIYYKGIEVKLNSTLNYNGLEVRITKDLIELNPKFFKVIRERETTMDETTWVIRTIIFKDFFG